MRADWKELFSDGILSAGRRLADEGRVAGLVMSARGCLARVRDSWTHSVRIVWEEDGTVTGSCDCSASREGYRCMHMAAVLFSCEERKETGAVKSPAASAGDSSGSAPAGDAGSAGNAGDGRPGTGYRYPVPAQANPYLGDPGCADLYFHPGRILESVSFAPEDSAEAAGYINRGELGLTDVRTHYSYEYSPPRPAGHARGWVRRNSGVSVAEVKFDRNRILSAACGACYRRLFPGDYYYTYTDRRICPHILGLFFLTAEYLKKYNPGDATDAESIRFLERMRSFRAGETAREEGKKREAGLRLMPEILVDSGRWFLRFRISDGGRACFVKNLRELVSDRENRELHEEGKNCRIDFALSDFDGDSSVWFRLIRDYLEGEELYRGDYGEERYFPGSVSCDRVPLAGEILDVFYDRSSGRTLEAAVKPRSGKQRKEAVTVADRAFALEISISPHADEETGETEGILLTGRIPPVMRGKSGRYVCSGQTLSRLGEAGAQAVSFFGRFDGGDIRMVIGRKRLPEFWYRTLPVLIGHECLRVNVEDREAIGRMLPPEVRYLFFLDVEDGRIECSAEAVYGEEAFVLRRLSGEDYPLAACRDASSEEEVVREIEEIFPRYLSGENVFISENDADSVYRILSGGIGRLMRIGEVHGTDAFNRLRIRKPPKLRFGVSVESDLLNLDISTDDLSFEELLELLESYGKRKKYHRLRSGDIVELTEGGESLELLQELLESTGADLRKFVGGKMHLPAYRALYLGRMLEEHDGIAADRDRHFRDLVRNFKTIRDADFEIPASLKSVMRPYQVFGCKWMRTLIAAGFGGILADDMGLGKTLQMISVILAEKEAGEGGLNLVVCPASLIYNWQEEFGRFAPSLTVVPVAGSLAERQVLLKGIAADGEGNPDVLITSYDLLRRDADLYADVSFRIQVLDEAQYIKNPGAALSKAVKITRSRYRFALTGTPIENRLSELWSIFDYLMPGFLFTYRKFSSEFETPIAKSGDPAVTKRLKDMAAPFILRRLKRDVLPDLPDKLEELRFAKFGEEQQKFYDAQVAHMKKTLAEIGAAEKMRVLAELTKIREICCDPLLISGDYRGGSAKREVLRTLVLSAIDGGHRILIFSQFTSMLALIAKDLEEEGISYDRIIGDTPKEERLRLVSEFNTGSTPVFLVSLKAGGTGLNLTGADVVIHYDPWWNLAAQNQATDRAHRIGQTKEVTVYRIIVKGTIEEKILRMQEAKQDLSDAVVSAGGESLAAFSAEELLGLFGV